MMLTSASTYTGNKKIEYISLFSGIGGFDLGFDRAGLECVLQVEKDEKARAVLAHHWPNVPKMELVEDVTKESIRRLGVETVDLICGGFPCQDISLASLIQKGLGGVDRAFGLKCLGLFAKLSPGGLWVKMYQHYSQVTMDGTSERFLGGWPRSGMMRNGNAYQHQPLVGLTDVTDSSLWPTPEASLGLIESYGGKTAESLMTGNGRRPSGARIGSSLKWEPRLYQDWLTNGRTGVPHPEFVEWLMGFPKSWTDLSNSETP